MTCSRPSRYETADLSASTWKGDGRAGSRRQSRQVVGAMKASGRAAGQDDRRHAPVGGGVEAILEGVQETRQRW